MPGWMAAFFSQFGYGAVFLSVFFNNIGLPVPGGTMLLAAGFLVGTGILSFWLTFGTATAACFLGTNFGYWIGRKYGHHVLRRFRWVRLSHKRIRHLDHFYKRYGAMGVFFARMTPLFHPLIGVFAGIEKTPGRLFLLFNFIGSAIYVGLYILGGEYLGRKRGFYTLWRYHNQILIVLVVIFIGILSVFLRHRVITVFGHPFYRRKRGWWD